jgi:hypothetical protein
MRVFFDFFFLDAGCAMPPVRILYDVELRWYAEDAGRRL